MPSLAQESWRKTSVDYLEASSYGRIRILPYEVRGRMYSGLPRYGDWAGARFVFMFRRKTYKVARLVCEAFHGPAPADKPNCLHRDEDARNNRPENLYWGTQKENLNAPGFLVYCRGRTGNNSPTSKGRARRSATT